MNRMAVEVESIMLKTLSRRLNGMSMLAFSALLALAVVSPTAAGDTLLSNNSGADNAIFFIEGEPSVVINGFDLTPLGVTLPVALDAVSISVQTAVPGATIDLLVYQDGNGGSPVDATLVYREQVGIGLTGLNRLELAEAAIITEPVVWVGFNLPVGFEFHADTSGSSVLTYWAWTTGGTFDLTSLASAGVLGPGDGSEPANIAMDGIARITAELRTAEFEEVAAGIPLGRQIVPGVAQDTSIMLGYDNCGGLLFDPEDIEISAESSFTLDCYVEGGFHSPTDVAQPQDQVLELLRIGPLYKLFAEIPVDLHAGGAVNTLPVPVTHCLMVPEEDLHSAVLGEVRAQFAPRTGPEKWVILPSVRFNNMVCAEVTVANYITYFVPETPESPQNVNLVLGWTEVYPHPLYCGVDASVRVPVVNTGQDWFDTEDTHITLSVWDVHVPSGIVTERRSFNIGNSQLGPGARQFFEVGPLNVDVYIDELHRLQVTVDADGEVDEIDEADNIWFSEYILRFPPGRDKCGPPPLELDVNRCEFTFEERYDGDDEDLLDALEDLEEAFNFSSRYTQDEAEGIFFVKDDLTRAQAEANAVRYLLGAVSPERWALLEAWFFLPQHRIAARLAPFFLSQAPRTHSRCY